MDKHKRVLILSPAREGTLHDKKFHDEEERAGSVPTEIPIALNVGFLGVGKQDDNSHSPQKKPPGGERTQVQKAANRALSQSRVVCENAFASVKRDGAVSAL